MKFDLLKLASVLTLVSIANISFASSMTTSAPQAYVIDVQSGNVLLDKNSTKPMYPASMTKIMTAYIVFEMIKSENISMDTKFIVSRKAWEKGGSKMFLKINKAVSVSDLLHGVIIQSGNDAAITLAEGIAGSEENFAQIMTQKAKSLGMNNTNFRNATGWPDKNHYTTAKDLGILSQAMITDFPEYYHIWSQKSFTYSKIKQRNRNPLLDKNIGADGLKTGHTKVSGYGLAGSAKQGNRRIIFILNGMTSKKERANESFNLAQDALYNFKNIEVLKAGQTLTMANVWMGNKKEIPLITKDNYIVTARITNAKDIKMTIKYNSPIEVPIKKGQKIGIIKVSQPGSIDKEFYLYAGSNATRPDFITRFKNGFNYLVLGIK